MNTLDRDILVAGKLYKELDTLANQDLAQLSNQAESRVALMAEQILAERTVMNTEPAAGTRLSPQYIEHLNQIYG
jgi:phage FluMu protein gp41